MSIFLPFSGYRYTTKVGDYRQLVCPLYDIISPMEEERLYQRSPYNFVHLELPRGKDKYQQANRDFLSWCGQGLLSKDKPCYYLYRQQYTFEGNHYILDGVIGKLLLENAPGNEMALHENTLSSAKEDRFRLLESTKCQFSPIICLYDDIKDFLNDFSDKAVLKAPLVRFHDDCGTIHTLWRISDSLQQALLQEEMKTKKLWMADGHHRFETALRYHAAYPCESSRYVMTLLYPMQTRALQILGTHRVLKDIADFDITHFLQQAVQYFSADFYQTFIQARKAWEMQRQSFLLIHSGGYYVLKWKHLLGTVPTHSKSKAYRELDVVILTEYILKKIFRFTEEDIKEQKNIFYTRKAEEADRLVQTKEANAAFLVHAARMDQLKAVADNGEKMPQKSTYFYPKPLAGLVFYGAGMN